MERAAATSAVIHALDRQRLEEAGILFVDEPLGVYVKDLGVGYAIRELPRLPDGVELMPMFSLYSKPFGGKPPLVEMVENSGLGARAFAESRIIAPLVAHFNRLAWEEGMVGEPHEQNLLLELKNGQPTGRVYYRDLAGFILNEKLRRAAGKDLSMIPPGIQPESLRPEYARPIENALNYLRQSNFYALRRALQPYYPEITDRWLDETFRRHMAAGVRKYTGVDSRDARDWKRAYRERIRAAAPGCRAAFQLIGGKP